MGLEIIYFVGAFILLVALIYGVLCGHFRSRAALRATDDIVRDRYRGKDTPASHWSPQGKAPRRPAEEFNGLEPDFSEDDIQRAQFGPRGVPGAPDPAKMTPQREKKTPNTIDQGHVS